MKCIPIWIFNLIIISAGYIFLSNEPKVLNPFSVVYAYGCIIIAGLTLFAITLAELSQVLGYKYEFQQKILNEVKTPFSETHTTYALAIGLITLFWGVVAIGYLAKYIINVIKKIYST